MKKKNLGFTLAEVLIVIGIIGVVAALTLPNLNHATGDKETVTRLQKAYSILNEANDRAVAIYGPISTWHSNCNELFPNCWMKRIGEFLKVSKSCDETSGDEGSSGYSSCEYLVDNAGNGLVYQLPDGITLSADGSIPNCDDDSYTLYNNIPNDVCVDTVYLDINGPNKGKHKMGEDLFILAVSNSLGIVASGDGNFEDTLSSCLRNHWDCEFWVLEYGNLDYLKADTSGKCNDSNIILDGTTNTSCH